MIVSKRRAAARPDDVADIDIAQTGPAIDRRFDVAAIEIHLRRGHGRFRAPRIRLRGIQFLARR